ncbi:cytochrome P450 [Xenorhabdus littoralis]|uniref:cytochrome P450 n=1 Tax=Xenorhabdus littoralis TaxID=2582835 RepID=UPI0029E802AF|nr:cytochrome P450 [Xenorhabdus sp. psl]MDX7992800.1 cytochrome P450 [Xenorhabdus sp. psl]
MKNIDLSAPENSLIIDEIGIHRFTEIMKSVHGDQFYMNFGDHGFYYMGKPEDIKTLFMKGRRTHRGPLKEIIGNGLFAVDTSKKSLETRKKIGCVYVDQMLLAQIPRIKMIMESHLKNTRANELYTVREIFTFCREASIRANVSLMFGESNAEELQNASRKILDYIDAYLFASGNKEILEYLDHDDFNKAKDRIYASVAESNSSKEFSFLAGLKRQFVREDGTPNLEVINAEVLSLLGSGVETAGAMMFWSLYYLSLNPVLQLEGQETPNDEEWKERFIYEALRLKPAAWAMFRQMPEDVQFSDGTLIPAGASVSVSPYITHRDPRFWKDPNVFNPSRFLEVSARERYARYEFFPFAAGTHRCIGERLAFMQIKAFLTVILEGYQVENIKNSKLNTRPRLSLEPEGNCLFRVLRRL